jgi:transposase, IS30 family
MGRRALDVSEREEISRGLAWGHSLAEIGRQIGRPTCTISREVARNGGRSVYRSWRGTARAQAKRCRPKMLKLVADPELAQVVRHRLEQRWSPQQIAGRLRRDHPDDARWWVSHETIYKALYLQGRGGLRKELTAALRTGRARRRPRGSRAGWKGSSIRDMVMIADRPAEAADRAVPGHWEGDLLEGAHHRSFIATLVERTSRFTMLVQLPEGKAAPHVAGQLADKITQLPDALRRTLTWDQGGEMGRHQDFTVATGVAVYFCDPHSPWQRPSNENTNGLLRQYFPKSTDLSVADPAALDAIADEINRRPRRVLDYMTPSERFAELVASTH